MAAADATTWTGALTVEGAVPNGTYQVAARELIMNGAEMQAFQVLAAGPRTQETHSRASDRPIQNGDLMRTDFGGGRCAGLTSATAWG